MHQRRLGTWLVIAAMSTALTGCSSSGLPTQCAAKPNGALCIKVIKVGKAVGDVIGYVSYQSTVLSGKTSRLVLSRYACDPGTSSQPACPASATYPDGSRRGLTPATFCKDRAGATVTASPGCHDSLAEDLASDGGWQGFSLGPNGQTFPAGTWLCISEQVRVGRSWQLVTDTTPLRACSQAG